jgi:hypothetical protein
MRNKEIVRVRMRMREWIAQAAKMGASTRAKAFAASLKCTHETHYASARFSRSIERNVGISHDPYPYSGGIAVVVATAKIDILNYGDWCKI